LQKTIHSQTIDRLCCVSETSLNHLVLGCLI